MRARTGDPPRTMPQKIIAGRSPDPTLSADLVPVKVDQVILARAPGRVLADALANGLKKTPIEIAVAYDTTCVTTASSLEEGPLSCPLDLAMAGIQIARPGIGFPGPVHAERFGAPARLALTDEPRIASAGGIGMLCLTASTAQLSDALTTGLVWLRPPRSIQIHLSGRLRPFVCARDVALELLRRGLSGSVEKLEREHRAPIVLEFAGPSARLLSVAERSVLCSVAPLAGASAALFVSDEKTEMFLRDQRRSKAHRALSPDPGAPCDEVLSVDLGGIDPLVMDDTGAIRGIREAGSKPVSQVILGGDSGTTLRDLLAVAMLLKSKRVPPKLDFIFAPPSRQMLEVLTQSGALADLIATGVRIIEPDQSVVSGASYVPPPGGISLRTADPDPRVTGRAGYHVVSAETLAYAVATGTLGDPRSFKRPVRVTVPRALPTDDVLVLRDKKGETGLKKTTPAAIPARPWAAALRLRVVTASLHHTAINEPVVLVARSADEVRELSSALWLATLDVRAFIAPLVPSQLATTLAAEGTVAFSAAAESVLALSKLESLSIGPAADWTRGITVEGQSLDLAPIESELQWLRSPSGRAPRKGAKA